MILFAALFFFPQCCLVACASPLSEIPAIFTLVEWSREASSGFNKKWNNFEDNFDDCPTYQKLSLAQARYLNPRVILIEGGTVCKQFCEQNGIEFIRFSPKELLRIRTFVEGRWIEPRYIRAVRPHNFLWAWIRFWMVEYTVQQLGIQSFVYAESDVLMYRSTKVLAQTFSEYSIASCVQWPVGNLIASFFTAEGFSDFLRFTEAGFPLGVETDMHAIYSYASANTSTNEIDCSGHRNLKKPGQCVCKKVPPCVSPPVRPKAHPPQFRMANLCRPWDNSLVKENMHLGHDAAYNWVQDSLGKIKEIQWKADCLPYIVRNEEVLQTYAIHFQGVDKRTMGQYILNATMCTPCICTTPMCHNCGTRDFHDLLQHVPIAEPAASTQVPSPAKPAAPAQVPSPAKPATPTQVPSPAKPATPTQVASPAQSLVTDKETHTRQMQISPSPKSRMLPKRDDGQFHVSSEGFPVWIAGVVCGVVFLLGRGVGIAEHSHWGSRDTERRRGGKPSLVPQIFHRYWYIFTALALFLILMVFSQPQSRSFTVPRETAPADMLQFEAVARKYQTDKVTVHQYEALYSVHIDPLIHHHRFDTGFKMLEIGLGCNMKWGVGASAKMWRELFPVSQLWFGEYDKDCVHAQAATLKSLDINVVTGDQADQATLHEWVRQTTGGFHLIVDDGGHSNTQILNSFNTLFHDALVPGGLYVIEDLSLGRGEPFADDRNSPIARVISEWIDQLLSIDARTNTFPMPRKRWFDRAGYKWNHTLPSSIKWINCQMEMCVIKKCEQNDARCPDFRQNQRTR